MDLSGCIIQNGCLDSPHSGDNSDNPQLAFSFFPCIHQEHECWFLPVNTQLFCSHNALTSTLFPFKRRLSELTSVDSDFPTVLWFLYALVLQPWMT